MTTSLVTGITGQDGYYLARQLLHEGQSVLAAEDPVRPLAGRIDRELAARVKIVPWNPRDARTLAATLQIYRPNAIYNLAARSSGRGMNDDPTAMLEENAGAVARMLEAIVSVDRRIRFCQASSSEMFGLAATSPQDVDSGFRPRSVYGAAKLAAHVLVDTYRSRYGLHASSAILYNHESPRRRPEFVSRRITLGVAAIATGRACELRLGSLEARRDWGYAADYVRAMRMMVDYSRPGDYIVASGIGRTVRDFCALAFSHAGLEWNDYVREDADAMRPVEDVPLVGDASRLRTALGWKPSCGFEALVAMMVDADIKSMMEGSEK